MSTYAIGDVQGCFASLQALLKSIQFNPQVDTLWLTGDLVNRGLHSLEVLRFVKTLPRARFVLGNHDLSLLALAYTKQAIQHHTLENILTAPDCEDLLSWLRHQPLIHYDSHFDCVLVHAGIPPGWSISEAVTYAEEVTNELQSPRYEKLLENMFGNEPKKWDPSLKGWDRLRYIINSLTRMRFCDAAGNLELAQKGDLKNAPSHLKPWFLFRKKTDTKIIFGHWAALQGQALSPFIEAIDTGCVWGGELTALRLEDWKRFAVRCLEK